jgi:hypothetical protein
MPSLKATAMLTAATDIRVEMMPRSFWDEDPRFLETFSDATRDIMTTMTVCKVRAAILVSVSLKRVNALQIFVMCLSLQLARWSSETPRYAVLRIANISALLASCWRICQRNSKHLNFRERPFTCCC